MSNPTTADSFLVVARHLALGSPALIPEADWGAAENARFHATASRAYYAAFLHLKYCLKAEIEKQGGCFPRYGRVHQTVLETVEQVLTRLMSPRRNILPKKLSHLKNSRTTADYVWDIRLAQKAADDSIANAEAVIKEIDLLSQTEIEEIAKAFAAKSKPPPSGVCPG